MKWRQDLIIFACPDDGQGIDEAKFFIKYHGFTDEDVKIIRNDQNQILIRTKREVIPKYIEQPFCDWMEENKGRLN